MRTRTKVLVIAVLSMLMIELASLLVNSTLVSDADKKIFKLQSEAHYKHINWMKLYTKYHPYLAYERQVGASPDSLLYEDADARGKVFRVGILGASLAEELVSEITPQGIKQFFVSELGSRGWKGEVEVVVLAAGAARQPRQLISSTLYKDEFNFFLSFEGINEMLTGHGTCAPAYFPLAIRGYDPEFTSPYQRALRLTQAIYNSGNAVFGSWLGSLATVKAFWHRLEPLLFSTFKHFESADALEIQAGCADRADNQRADALAWRKFLNRQHQILNSGSEVRLITFLQPSQYLPGAKIITAEEKKIFSRVSLPTQEHFANTYAAGLAEIRPLGKDHPGIVDLTMVFKNDSETLYKDDCCHLNLTGYQKLWVAATEEIRKQLPKQFR